MIIAPAGTVQRSRCSLCRHKCREVAAAPARTVQALQASCLPQGTSCRGDSWQPQCGLRWEKGVTSDKQNQRSHNTSDIAKPKTNEGTRQQKQANKLL